MEKQIKGLIYDIRGFSVNDGPGIRKTVFLKGCPLRCSWCHNPESFEFRTQNWLREEQTGSQIFNKMAILGRFYTTEEIVEEIITDVPFFEQSSGGVTLSGGEPLAQPDFSYEVLEKCKQLNIHTCVDTSGYGNWQDFQRIATVTDLFLFDLKLADPAQHEKYTGRNNRSILENLMKLRHMNSEIHIRIPLVEDITDTTENLDAIKRIITVIPGLKRIDLLPYHTIARRKYRRMNLPYEHENMPEYPLDKAEKIMQNFSSSAEMVTLGG